MGQTIRISLPGYNAGTDTNIDHFALYADSDNVLIKEKNRGTMNVAYGTPGTITHGLGYVPFYAVYMDDGSKQNWIYGLNIHGKYRAHAGTNTITLINNASGTKTFYYYIFYDQQV